MVGILIMTIDYKEMLILSLYSTPHWAGIVIHLKIFLL